MVDRAWSGRLADPERADLAHAVAWTFAFIGFILIGTFVGIALQFAGSSAGSTSPIFLFGVVAGLLSLARRVYLLHRVQRSVADRLGISASVAKKIDIRSKAGFDASTKRLSGEGAPSSAS